MHAAAARFPALAGGQSAPVQFCARLKFFNGLGSLFCNSEIHWQLAERRKIFRQYWSTVLKSF
jgi:hypothetical protein